MIDSDVRLNKDHSLLILIYLLQPTSSKSNRELRAYDFRYDFLADLLLFFLPPSVNNFHDFHYFHHYCVSNE